MIGPNRKTVTGAKHSGMRISVIRILIKLKMKPYPAGIRIVERKISLAVAEIDRDITSARDGCGERYTFHDNCRAGRITGWIHILKIYLKIVIAGKSGNLITAWIKLLPAQSRDLIIYRVKAGVLGRYGVYRKAVCIKINRIKARDIRLRGNINGCDGYSRVFVRKVIIHGLYPIIRLLENNRSNRGAAAYCIVKGPVSRSVA